MKILTRVMSAAVLSGMLLVPVSEAKTRIYVRVAPPPVVVEHRTWMVTGTDRQLDA
jgi:hypothetical protein